MGLISYGINRMIMPFVPKKMQGIASQNLMLSPETAMRWALRSERKLDSKVRTHGSAIVIAISELRKLTPNKNPKEWDAVKKRLDKEVADLETLFKAEMDAMVKVDLQLESTMNAMTHSIIEDLTNALMRAQAAGLDPSIYGELRMKLYELETRMEKLADDLRREERRQAVGAFILQQYKLSSTKRILRKARRAAKHIKADSNREVKELQEMSEDFEKGDELGFKDTFIEVLSDGMEELHYFEAIAEDNMAVAYRARESIQVLLGRVRYSNELRFALHDTEQKLEGLLKYEQDKLDLTRRSMTYAYQVISQAIEKAKSA